MVRIVFEALRQEIENSNRFMEPNPDENPLQLGLQVVLFSPYVPHERVGPSKILKLPRWCAIWG